MQILVRKVQNNSPLRRCTVLAKKSAKLIANFSATKMTSLPSVSLCICLSRREHLTHNTGSAEALPILCVRCTRCVSPCARGQIRAKSDLCSAVDFLAGTICAGFFLSCPTPVLSGRISLQPITKLPSLLKYFAVVLNYLPNEWILRGEAPRYWLRPVLSTRGEQLIPADDRKEETYSAIAFLRKNRHLSLVPTLCGYALKVS